MATEWVFKLRDQISGPAQDIQQQLTRVTAALRQLDIQTKQARLEKTLDPLKRQRLELQLQRDKLLQSKRALDDHARANTSASRSWTDALVKWAGSLYILDTVRRAFGAVGRAALEMGSQVKDAIETRQRGLFGLRATMGNADGGNFFQQLERQAQAYGRPPGEIVGMGASFAELGASPNIARALVAAVSDVRARTGGRVNIAEQIRSILTSPVLGVGNVEAFSGAFPLKNLWASIGQRMKMRPGDAEQMFRLNQVRGGPGSPLIASLLDTVADLPGQGGRIGTMAQRFGGTTLEGSIGRVQTAWESFLASIENSRGIRTLQQVLQNLAATLGGSGMRGSLRSLADTLGEALKPLTGPEGKARMEAFFDAMTQGVQQVLGVLGPLVRLMDRFAPSEGAWRTAMNDALRAKPDQMFLRGGIAVSPEEFYGLPGGQDATFLLNRRAEIAREIFARESSPSSQRGYAGAERHVTLQLSGPLVQVDARGTQDAHQLADVVAEKVADELEKLTTQQAGGVP